MGYGVRVATRVIKLNYVHIIIDSLKTLKNNIMMKPAHLNFK